MSSGNTNPQPYPARYVAVGVCLAIGVFASWQMLERPLWGWWPLAMELAFFGAITIFFFPHSAAKRKWMGGALLAGVLLGLGFPPSWFTFLVFFGWVPLLAIENSVFQHQDRIRPWLIFRLAFHAFAVWNIISTFWVTNTALVAGLIANFLNAALMACAFMVFHVLRRKLPNSWAPLVFISTWLSFEYLHYFWDISWPWLTLGNSLSEYPWAVQWYEYTGTFGGSLWILGVNYLAYELVQRWLRVRKVHAWTYPTLLFIPIAISLFIGSQTKPSSNEPITVNVIQPNFEPHYVKFDIPQAIQTNRILSLIKQSISSEVDYIALPETSIDDVRINFLPENRDLQKFSDVLDSFPETDMIAGITSYRTFPKGVKPQPSYRTHIESPGDTVYWDVQNSAIEWEAGSTIPEIYFKSKLVPGPEIFPFRDALFFLKPVINKLGGTYEGLTTQKERSIFTGGKIPVAPVICYESIYGAFCGGYVEKGAQAFFILTNDGWWDNTPGHIQHLKIGALRAIEYRRPIARAANSGISCSIDILGHIHNATEYGTEASVLVDIIPENRITFYAKWGDYITKCAVLILCICFCVAIFTNLFQKKATPTI